MGRQARVIPGDSQRACATAMLQCATCNLTPASPVWPIIWSLVWVSAIIATAFLFKGNPAEDWIEAALVVGALTFVVLKRKRPASPAK